MFSRQPSLERVQNIFRNNAKLFQNLDVLKSRSAVSSDIIILLSKLDHICYFVTGTMHLRSVPWMVEPQ